MRTICLMMMALILAAGCQTTGGIDWDDPLVQVGIDAAIRGAARFGTTFTLELAAADRETAETVRSSLLTAAAYLNNTPADEVVDEHLLGLIPDQYEGPIAEAIAIVRAFADRYDVPNERVKSYLLLAFANAIVGCDDYLNDEDRFI